MKEKRICSNCGKDCTSHYFECDVIDTNENMVLCADCTSEYLTRKQWEQNRKIAVLEKALGKCSQELCFELSCGICPVHERCKKEGVEKALSAYFIDQAEKELKDEKR